MSEQDKQIPGHDPAISAIYRKTANIEPPAAMDEVILSSAKRVARQRKQRWILPLSTAAVVMLSVTLMLNMNREWDFSRELPDTTPPSQPEAKAKTKPSFKAEAQAPASEEAADDAARELVPAEKPAPSARHRAMAPDTTGLKSDRTAPADALTEQEARAQSQGEFAISDDFSFPQEAADEASAVEEERASPPPPMPGESMQKKAAARGLTSMEGSAEEALQPEPWLQKIRKLLESGEENAARKELEAFKKEYPDYTLPEDIKSIAPLEQEVPASR